VLAFWRYRDLLLLLARLAAVSLFGGAIEDHAVLDRQSEGFWSSVLVHLPAMSHKPDSAKSLVR
jgi:hypothetical protein